MKKIYLLLFCFLFAGLLTSRGTVIYENVYKKLNADSASYDLVFGPMTGPTFTFNFFAIPGSVSISGKLTSEFSSTILCEPIGSGNYTPIRLYNNKDFTSYPFNSYQRNPVFIHNNNLTFDNKFKGKGNNYLATRIILPATKDTIYMWMLVNLNAAGTELNIIKLAYDDESGKRPVTGTEGQTMPTGMLEELGNSLTIFPNPAKETIMVSLSENVEGNIHIFNVRGDEVLSSADLNKAVRVVDWPAGIYLVRVETLYGVLTRKLLIE